MHLLGWIDRLPRLLGVQASGASSVVKAFRDGIPPVAMEARTMADSIQVGYPKNWRKALTAIAESNGSMIAVEDEEILEAIAYTGRLTGVFAEPAASAATAGLARAAREGIVGEKESALVVVTGNGLKDTASARRIIGKPIEAARDGAGLEEIFRREGLMAGR
jgi:threonine synthase